MPCGCAVVRLWRCGATLRLCWCSCFSAVFCGATLVKTSSASRRSATQPLPIRPCRRFLPAWLTAMPEMTPSGGLPRPIHSCCSSLCLIMRRLRSWLITRVTRWPRPARPWQSLPSRPRITPRLSSISPARSAFLRNYRRHISATSTACARPCMSRSAVRRPRSC